MDWNRVCPACMNEYTGKGGFPEECPFCGYGYFDSNGYDVLPPRTILNGKYILGRLLKQEHREVLYLAYDLNLEVKIHIRELFPSAIVCRGQNGRTVMVKSETDIHEFENMQSEFLEAAKRSVKGATLSGDEVKLREVFRENGTVYKVLMEDKYVNVRNNTEDDTEPTTMELLKRGGMSNKADLTGEKKGLFGIKGYIKKDKKGK